MKPLSILLVLLFCVTALFSQPVKQIGLGIDFPGTHTVSYNGSDADEDSGMGASPCFELLFSSTPQLLLGGGIEFQIPRKLDVEGWDATYNFIPIYMSMHFAPSMSSTLRFELIGNLGFNFLSGNDDYKGDGDLSGGMYLGFGAGIVSMQGLTFDLMYRIHNGSVSYENYYNDVNFDISQKNLTARLGYRF